MLHSAVMFPILHHVVPQSEDDENWEKWENNSLSAMEKRVLVTHWVGEGYKKWCGPKYDQSRASAFDSTGCSTTMDTKNDKLVDVKGLHYDLEFAPPGTKFTDKDYVDDNYSRSADFVPMCPKDKQVKAKAKAPICHPPNLAVMAYGVQV